MTQITAPAIQRRGVCKGTGAAMYSRSDKTDTVANSANTASAPGIIDVSTIKELSRRWFPRAYFQSPEKTGNHRALGDIKDSIDELRYYKQYLFAPTLPGAPPTGTPPTIIERLQREAKRALNTPEVLRRMEIEGTDVVGSEAREFGADVKAEYEKWRALVKKTGMKS